MHSSNDATENTRAVVQGQTDRLETLNEIGRVMSSTLDLQMLYDTIYQQIGRVMDASQFFIALQDEAEGSIIVPYLREAGRLLLDQVMPAGPSMTGTIIASGQPLLFQTTAEYEERVRNCGLAASIVGEQDSESGIFVPLHTGSRTIGALTVQSPQPAAYTADDMRMLGVLASQAAIAIENARLYTEQQRRVDELQGIQSIVQKLTPLHDEQTVADVISKELTKLIDYHICGVFELDVDRDVLVPIVFHGTQFPFPHVKLKEGLTGWVGFHGRSALVRRSDEDPRVAYIPGSPETIESLISAPLVYEGRVRGVITLSKLGVDQFDQNSLRLLEIIAAQTAIAFDRARLYTELRTDAVTDPLTRLYNRRYLLDRLTEERSRARRNHHSLFALMLDLDHFKAVNDRYGHDAGDVALRELAHLLRSLMRAEDLISRYGGEEFCLLVPEITLAEATVLAERLRRAVAEHHFPVDAGVRHLTLSVGAAALQPDDRGSEVVSRADGAMYRVKASGGNGVCFYDEDGQDRSPPGSTRFSAAS